MSLSNDAKKILVVAMTNASKAAEVSAAIDTNTVANTASTAHTSADGKSHSDVLLNNTHRASVGTNHANVVLNDTHRASAGINHSDVVLNSAARNTNWKVAAIMLATATDNTDAATMSVVVGDFVIEIDQAGNATTASGVITYNDEFLGDVAEITQVIADSRTNSTDGDYFDIDAKSGNLYRVYLDTTGGSSTIPAAGGRTLVEVDISGVADSAAGSGDALAVVMAALDGTAEFTAPATGTGTILITDNNTGLVTDAVEQGGGMANLWAVSNDTQGAAGPAATDNVLVHYKPIV